MNIILHGLDNLDYLSLEKALSEKAVEFNPVDKDDKPSSQSEYGGFHEFIDVAVPITNIAITAIGIWLRSRKPKEGRKITIETNGTKVTVDLDKPESTDTENFKDVKEILEGLTKI